MKRFFAILLTVCLLFSVTAVAANETQTLLETVKSRIGDTTEYEIFNSSSYTDQGQTIYSFNWEDNDSDHYRCIYVSVTASGVITDYSFYEDTATSRSDKPSLNQIPIEQVQAAAEEFLKKMDPDVAGSLKLTPRKTTQSLWSQNYRFTVQRMENGVPVYDDDGSITVSADGKTVTGFYMQYTEGLTFPDPAAAISRDAAEKAYSEKLGMELCYLTKYEDGVKTAYPAYCPAVRYGTYIDALTGLAVTPATYPLGADKNMFDCTTEEAADSAGGSLSPAEQQEMENIAGLMTVQDAEKLLRENAILGIPADAEVTRSGLSKEYYGESYLYSLRFRSADQTISVSMDAATGQVYSYNRYGELAGSRVTEDAAKKTAQDAAAKLAGELLKEYRLGEDGFSYTRYVNGIPYYNDGISVEIDLESGLLTWFYLSYSDIEFPSVEGVMTADQAAEKFFNQVDYDLYYVKDCVSDESKTFDKTDLVYRVTTNGSLELDPFTGEMEKSETAQLPEYTDVAGHYGETAIETLRQFGIGFASEEFQPNATITQGEFLQMLQVVFFGTDSAILTEGADYADAKYVAVNEGVISGDVDLTAPLTREVAAVLLIRAMGYEEVAKLQNIYLCPFQDVTENKGYVCILGAMGVFHGDGKGNFLPDKLLTRADAAIVLYNYLNA